MSLSLVTPPAVEPVSLFEMKTQLGLSPVEDTDQVKSEQLSAVLRRYIRTAREECEARTGRAFITQTWKYTREGWGQHHHEYDRHVGHGFWLPKPPLQTIASVQYIDVAGVLQTLTPVTGYNLDPGGETMPARIMAAYQTPWPVLRCVQANVIVTLTGGFGDTSAAVPMKITQAILFLAHSYYDSSAFKDVDRLVDGLLSGYINRIA